MNSRQTHSKNTIPNYTAEFYLSFLLYTLLNIFTLIGEQKKKCLDQVGKYVAANAMAVPICQVFQIT